MRKLLFVYDHFYPAYRAGGPIQSLANLASVLMHDYEILVVASNKDHNTDTKLDEIETGKWNNILLPGQQKPIQVWYEAKKHVTKRFFISLLQDKQPDVIYLNGMFSFRFVLLPLLAARSKQVKVVLCPRGMLQAGALAGKSLKKKIYLGLLTNTGLLKNIKWHATNNEEATDIRKVFGNKASIVVAGNIPKLPYPQHAAAIKKEGVLHLVYISLIAAKKNLLQLIELVNNSTGISLDIYGPVKDKAYWQSCQQAMEAGKGRVQYRGELQPEEVQAVFCRYDASVLLTRGENFGHALYESLSVGRPVITSYFTPWNNLENKAAGWNLDISDNDSCQQKLAGICRLNAEVFDHFSRGALALAKEYYTSVAANDDYHPLFSN